MTQPASLPLLDPAHLAELCHELRQPLHAYRMFSDRLTPLLTDEPLALVTQMNVSILSLTEMSQTLHELARALDPNALPQLRPVELQPLLADLQESFANPRLSVRQTTLVSETDSTRLAIILKHLVRNALQHGSGRCLIGCRKHAGKIRLDVIDQGPGLPEKSAAANSRHGKSGLAQAHPGLGLGLHIVRQLAARLGIALDLVSRPGHGTRASLHLHDATVASSQCVLNKNRQLWLSGKTIQLAGMNPSTRNELQNLLSTWGAQVTLDNCPPDTPAADLLICDSLAPVIRPDRERCPLLILAAPPSLPPTPGVRYLPPPSTPPRLRMAIANILGS